MRPNAVRHLKHHMVSQRPQITVMPKTTLVSLLWKLVARSSKIIYRISSTI